MRLPCPHASYPEQQISPLSDLTIKAYGKLAVINQSGEGLNVVDLTLTAFGDLNVESQESCSDAQRKLLPTSHTYRH